MIEFEHRYQFTRMSANKKLGFMPASATSRSTCPSRCSLKGDGGCYAEDFHLRLNWNAIDKGKRGGTLDEFCEQIKTLPRGQLWRWAQAGDLPGDQMLIDHEQLHKIVSANRTRRGFGFTHYDPRVQSNAAAIGYANAQGFTLNLSAETITEADEFTSLGVGPVVVILPVGASENFTTPGGNTVKVCPATISDVTCSLCAICANPKRTNVIGFPAHGSGKAQVQRVFYMAKA
jgi:hypothetical protein